MKEQFHQKITDKTAVVGVIGLGYVSLPLIHTFMNVGFSAVGFDVDQRKVDSLLAGRSYIEHIPNFWIKEWGKAASSRRLPIRPI